MEYPGNLFVVAAPSGAGKSSLVKALMELDSRVAPSVSHTTRPPRGQELHGREYYFVSKETFDHIKGEFAECWPESWASSLYGFRVVQDCGPMMPNTPFLLSTKSV